MIGDLWLNLPVKDVAKAKAFFTAIGFAPNPGPGNSEHSASFAIGTKKVILMLFEESVFRHIARASIPHAADAAEVLISLGADSRQFVDEIADKAAKAGGDVFAQPEVVQGWMYGCGFTDLDGHRWNVLFMDPAQMPKH